MRKSLVVILGLLILPFGLMAADRVVVLEIVTATWCPPCAGAAWGAEDLVDEYQGEILVLEYHYHSSDPFNNTPGFTRYDFYNDVFSGIPAAFFDGVDTVIGAWSNKSAITLYEPKFTNRRKIESPLEILLDQTEESYLAQGTLTATITNTSEEEITGKVHFTVTESNIRYAWQIHTVLHFVVRDMLPDADGALITLAAGADTTITREYEIDPDWLRYTDDLGNIEFGCFVQDDVSEGLPREIFQAAVIPLSNELMAGVKEEKPTTLPFSLDVPAVVKNLGSVRFSLGASSDVDLILFDASGRQVSTLHKGSLGAGNHQIPFETGGLPSGAYFIKLSCGSFSEVGKMLVIH
ncbi:hypothetical protein JXM67_09555 [candidate division WOR-3 bacterium]|nr:hypothetical protein [candidate division WOR-3 bacterium]